MMKMMKKKLKRILKNEWVKKVIIILLAILVASITTSFCFGIKKAEGGEGHEGHESTGSAAANEAEDDEEDAEADAEDLWEDEDDEEDAEADDEDSPKKKREKFICDELDDKKIKGKTTDQIIEILVALHKKEHKKRYEEEQEIDDLKDEVKSYREQNNLLLAVIDKMDRRFTTMFSTQFGLLDPALTPERMEAAVRELAAKKEELLSGISQRKSLLSAIEKEIKRLEKKDRLSSKEKVQLGLNQIQKEQIEREIQEMIGSLEEVVTRAKLIEGRRTQVTGAQPTKPFGPETAPQVQTPETAASQPAEQSVEARVQRLSQAVAALLRRGGTKGRSIPNNGRQPARGQIPPLTGRGQRGIVAN